MSEHTAEYEVMDGSKCASSSFIDGYEEKSLDTLYLNIEDALHKRTQSKRVCE